MYGIISSMLFKNIRYVVEHDLVDCIVTSAGGVEEDLIKCLAPSYLGAFDLHGKTLRRNGLNRLRRFTVIHYVCDSSKLFVESFLIFYSFQITVNFRLLLISRIRSTMTVNIFRFLL